MIVKNPILCYTVETGNESFLDLNRTELDECVYGEGGGKEISDRRSSIHCVVTLYATANAFPPDRPADECSRWNTSRVKGLQKAAAVDRNKRLKMFWLKNIKKPNAFVVYLRRHYHSVVR